VFCHGVVWCAIPCHEGRGFPVTGNEQDGAKPDFTVDRWIIVIAVIIIIIIIIIIITIIITIIIISPLRFAIVQVCFGLV